MAVSPAFGRCNKLLFLLFGLLTFFFFFLLPDRSLPSKPGLSFGRVNNLTSSSRLAIATFLSAAEVGTEEDYYYKAARVLIYQILHDPHTRCNRSIEFIVLVTPTVAEDTRRQLTADGAKVIQAEKVPSSWWIKTGVTRWKDQFSKLRLLQMTEFDRILFLDADTLVMKPLDGIFDDLEVVTPVDTFFERNPGSHEAPLPAQYMFAARSDNALTGERNHPFPPLQTNVFSAGFWIAAPSIELFEHMMSIMNHYRRFDPHTMEQSLLNYVFRRNGPMPWREIHYKWSATWPGLQDKAGGVATLHEKLGMTGPQELRDLWYSKVDEMQKYYSGNSIVS